MNVLEIDNIVLNLDRKILGNESKVALKVLKTKDIPSFIKNYFDREAEQWIREESSMFLSSGRFNYDLPEVRKKFDELYDLLKETAIFGRAKLHRVMEQAVKLQTNFLVSPQRTMVQFIYRDNDAITPEEVMNSMKYFLDYAYYYKALEEFFKTNKMETISNTKFKNFIAQLDEMALGQNKTSAAVNVAKVVVGFLNLGREKESETLDADILVNAYQDRNLPEYVKAMKQAIDKGKTSVSVSQLESMLKSFLETGDIEPKVVAKPAKVDVKYEEKTEIFETKNLSHLVSKIEDVKEEAVAESMDSFFQEEEDDIVLAPQPEMKPVAVVDTSKVAISDQLADHMAKQMGQAEVLEDLNKMIEDGDKKTFIKKLFKKNDKEFFALITELNGTPSWKDANNFIDDTFYRLGINPYQKEALALTDAIYARYFPKG